VKLDSDEYSVEKDEHNDEPVEHLRLDDVTHSEPSVSNHTAQRSNVQSVECRLYSQ